MMSLSNEIEEQLIQFSRKSHFLHHGCVVTDLDGTAVHEADGHIYIPEPVELGLKQMYDLKRPLMLNSLRFPLSVMRTFGKEWYSISNAPIPASTLNGSLLGYVNRT